jgi:hypothetical protein
MFIIIMITLMIILTDGGKSREGSLRGPLDLLRGEAGVDAPSYWWG